jgi:hypothetical protein
MSRVAAMLVPEIQGIQVGAVVQSVPWKLLSCVAAVKIKGVRCENTG